MRQAAPLLLALGLIAAGCGAGVKSPGVASLANGSTTTSQKPSAGGLSASGPGGGQGFHLVMKANLKFSQCMRTHGVSNFPDPNAAGDISIDSSSGLDPKSPTFRSAEQACNKDLPNGGRATPQQIAKAKQSALAYSACMRKHGIKDFPDPNFLNGGVQIRLHGGGDMDPNNPTFQKAQNACRGDISKP